MVEFLSQPWPWWVAGPLISLVMFLLLFFGRSLGVSSTLRTLCSAGGAGKVSDFFRHNWKGEMWNIVFVIGGLIGAFIASQFLMNPDPIALNPKTVEQLQGMGIENPGTEYVPTSIFSWSGLLTPTGFILMVVGGFLVGFGARYAGGCTSGHGISGMSNLQWPSLVAVIGFFIGGMFTTFVLLPFIMKL